MGNASSSSLLIKNCTFMYHELIIQNKNGLVRGEISANNATIQFENCALYNNTATILLEIVFLIITMICVHIHLLLQLKTVILLKTMVFC